jgi:hypothetical protein
VVYENSSPQITILEVPENGAGSHTEKSRIADRKEERVRYRLFTSALALLALVLLAGTAFAEIKMCSGECIGTTWTTG